MQGAIRSFDRSHKGSGLALINEILGGPLVGAAFCGLGNSKGNWGHLIYAIDPDILGDREEFIRQVGEIITRVKGTRKLPGVGEIFLPGERGAHRARQHRERGMIEVEDNLLTELRVWRTVSRRKSTPSKSRPRGVIRLPRIAASIPPWVLELGACWT